MSYTYDANGNLTQVMTETYNGSSWVQSELWNYAWNPRDQMTKAERRTGTGAGVYAGKVEYGYCLSCGGALAWRKKYSTSSSTTIESWKRYEYDGINLLRVDEKYDVDSDGFEDEDPWRTLEVSTRGVHFSDHRCGPGRVYWFAERTLKLFP